MSERGDITPQSRSTKNMILGLSFSIFRSKFDFQLDQEGVKSWTINLILNLGKRYDFAI